MDGLRKILGQALRGNVLRGRTALLGPRPPARVFASRLTRMGEPRALAQRWARSLDGTVPRNMPPPSTSAAILAGGLMDQPGYETSVIQRVFLETALPRPDDVRTWSDFIALALEGGATSHIAEDTYETMNDAVLAGLGGAQAPEDAGDGGDAAELGRHKRALDRKLRHKRLEGWRASEVWRAATLCLKAPSLKESAHARMVKRLLADPPGHEHGPALRFRRDRGLLLIGAHTTFLSETMRVVRRERRQAHVIGASAARSAAERNALLVGALKTLKNGGVVVMSPDGAKGTAETRLPVLDLEVRMGTSFTYLAERAGARMVRIVVSATDPNGAPLESGLVLRCAPVPLGTPADDAIAAYGRFMEMGTVRRPFDFGRMRLAPPEAPGASGPTAEQERS